jgi:hypothetical protein
MHTPLTGAGSADVDAPKAQRPLLTPRALPAGSVPSTPQAKDPASLQRFTESEVIHGRWAMLGVAGSLGVELLGFGNWYDAPLWVSDRTRAFRCPGRMAVGGWVQLHLRARPAQGLTAPLAARPRGAPSSHGLHVRAHLRRRCP